jgi:hypothetical protein
MRKSTADDLPPETALARRAIPQLWAVWFGRDPDE